MCHHIQYTKGHEEFVFGQNFASFASSSKQHTTDNVLDVVQNAPRAMDSKLVILLKALGSSQSTTVANTELFACLFELEYEFGGVGAPSKSSSRFVCEVELFWSFDNAAVSSNRAVELMI